VAKARWRHRRYTRGFSLDVPGELLTKSSADPARNKMRQQAVAKVLKEGKRALFRSQVAVSLRLRPSSRTPPSLHRAVKYLLDILGKPASGTNISRKWKRRFEKGPVSPV